jgi:hypothetical protein
MDAAIEERSGSFTPEDIQAAVVRGGRTVHPAHVRNHLAMQDGREFRIVIDTMPAFSVEQW